MYVKDVPVNRDLLEEARKVVGEDLSSFDIVDKALSELVRIARLKRGIQAMKETSDAEMAPPDLPRDPE